MENVSKKQQKKFEVRKNSFQKERFVHYSCLVYRYQYLLSQTTTTFNSGCFNQDVNLKPPGLLGAMQINTEKKMKHRKFVI